MRYTTIRPRMTPIGELQDSPLIEGRTVHEREPEDTGLLNHEDHPIYRVTSPIGFIELRERGKK